MKNKKVLFLGFGYTAQHTSNLLQSNNYEIFGTTRDVKSKILLNNANLTLIDYHSDEVINAINQVQHIVVSIPPIVKSNSYEDPALNLISYYLQKNDHNLKSITYLSSTGVYGDHSGAWIDENTVPNPNNFRGEARLMIEKSWQNLCTNSQIPLRIFRLAGIYGPNRSALERVKKNDSVSIYKQDQVFCRIHVEDIANILYKAINEKSDYAGTFNLADDYPCNTIEVNNYAANLLGISEPEIINLKDAKLSIMGQEFYSSCKRVSNKKIKQLLSMQLIYPTYKEGLNQIYRKFYLP